MTPFEISIILHYYACANDFRDGDFSAPILEPTLEKFVQEGFLKHASGGSRKYGIAERGKVYVEALQKVPWPRWAVPVG